MHPSFSNRCKLFERIAEEVWYEIIQQRSTGPEPIETGITSRLISKIRFAFGNNPNIGIWGNNAYRESEYGGDIDVFVEIANGEFVWYALQAKVQKISGYYESMCHEVNDSHQWDKLVALHELADCVPYFLMFNGEPGFSIVAKDICGRPFREPQFGCSLITIDAIKSKSLDRLGNCRPPSFYDFHPMYAQPWRILACCLQPKNKRRYRLEQIQEYTGPYELLSNQAPKGMEEELEEIWSNSDGDGTEAITNLSREANRKSENILMFRRNT